MIDFHCHLDLFPNPKEIVARCCQERLYVLSVTTVPSAFEGTLALAPPEGRIRTALGLHPELAAARAKELPLFERLLPLTRYIGEVGLDGSRPHRATLDKQAGVLRDVLRMCSLAGGRVISVHSRGASGEILELLSTIPEAGTFVLHWYTGSRRQVERAAEMGCWFSVNPAMFYSERGIAAVSAMPCDRVVPESDGPFGTVEGRPAGPWDTWSIVPSLASCWKKAQSDAKDMVLAAFVALVTSTGDPTQSYDRHHPNNVV